MFADELDIPLLPKSGYQWMAQGTQVEVLTPSKNQKRYLAGAWDSRTGVVHHCCGPRKSNQLFRDLLEILARRYPDRHHKCIYVVVDNYRIHKAQAVQCWLATQPRFHLLWLPTYCPRANLIERLFGDVHDKITRNHNVEDYATSSPLSLVISTIMDLGFISSPPSIRSPPSPHS